MLVSAGTAQLPLPKSDDILIAVAPHMVKGEKGNPHPPHTYHKLLEVFRDGEGTGRDARGTWR